MWVSIAFAILIVYSSTNSIFQLALPITQQLNQICLNLNPLDSDYDNIWNSLICGKNLNETEFSNQIKASGLIHIFVISGSHFLVLLQIFKLLRVPSLLTVPLLFIFNLFSGFTAPGTRACLGVYLNQKLKLNGHQKVLCVSIATLIINPEWLRSYSFWLSWLASLILEISPKDRFRITQNSLYFLTWLLLGQSLSFWSLPLNIMIAPLIGWVLFPVGLLAFVPGFDLLFNFLMKTLESIFELINLGQKKVPFGFELWGLSLLTLLSHFFIMALDLRKKGRILS
jgi:predicted membrane metal-binding protein